MSLCLSDRDQHLLTKVSETILSPGAYAAEPHWHHAVMAGLMELTNASMSAIRVAEPGGFRMTPLGFAEEAIEAHKNYYHRFDFGRALGEKPILGEVFSRNEYYGERLPQFRRTEYYSDYITKYRAFDALCLSTRRDEHQKGIVLYLWHDQEMDAGRRTEALAMLRLLIPSFRAGMMIGSRMHRHRESVLSTFEECTDGCAIFNENAVLLHKNPALARTFAETEYPQQLSSAILESVNAIRDAHISHAGLTEGYARMSALHRFGSEEYAVAACILELAASNAASILVTVTRKGLRQLGRNDLQLIRDKYSLTQRESEVAILLRSRHTNHEIAERLGVSEHTARHHTENVLRKLRAGTRTEVARILANSGTAKS